MIEHDATYCYGDVAAGIVQWTRALAASSVRSGMLVGLQCQPRYLQFLLIQACQILGATSVSLSPGDITGRDPILDRCDFLCLQRPIERPRGGLLPLSQGVIDQVTQRPLTQTDLRLLDHCPAETDILRLVKTSGSTGRPKVMAMSHAAMNILLRKTLWFPDDPGYAWNFLNLYDFTLRSALRETEIALRFGQTAVASTMETVFADMRRFPAFRMTVVSGDAIRLAAAVPPDWPGPRAGVLSIKGGALPDATRSRLKQAVATHVYHSYGAIEIHRLSMIDEQGVGSVDPGMRVRIVDDDGADLPIGTIGQIEITPALVDRYLWDEEATALAFRDGWYRTRDLGFIPEPGRLVVLGRADDMVNIGGVKFAPQARENRIKSLPGIRDAVLLAVPAADGIEQLVVAVETDMTHLTPPLERAILEILAGTAHHGTLRLLANLPRTETGKVQRQALRAALMHTAVVPHARATEAGPGHPPDTAASAPGQGVRSGRNNRE